ncbi:BlaI/MecI/CopY family transcriptional regulator [Phenylobacterium sp.]|uniref:BlaI/MecI/CopY family transcriptional regulator n=1 Tax=Phenylobacterium sp. TaxID=1871053 RepID=UPI0025DFA0D9|nr:BlaI/MecI/CopY family transcriptional regulator [Phenylobacterium sp.]MBX3486236.1 BlaI/MecI/CopY family transcriptional regulator [Phenylobacterium sp.]MCW5760673.1 BlaI/MecI/CopY family transcriptional regulator [Phenylobacterium sp.]
MSKISGAESQIMEALWASGQMTADEIVQSVGPRQGWGEATVKTLINRLLKKKALASERTGGRAIYRTLVSREDYVTGESQGLLDRLFGGQVAPLVAHYAQHRALSAEEVARLKTLIAEFEADDD